MRRRANEIFSLENLTQLTLFAVGILVALSIGYPQFFPQFTRGADCADLPNPPGGNQRSLLQYNDDSQTLEIDVLIDDVDDLNGEYRLSQTEPFSVQVVFRNMDVSPLYLFYNEGRNVAERVRQGESSLPGSEDPGLYLIFYPSNDSRENLPLATEIAPLRTWREDYLYVLQAKQSCNVHIELNPNNIPNFSPSQTYTLVAVYQSADAGIFPTPGLTPTATAIPELTDTQGVWDGGRIYSDPIRVIFQ